MPDLDVIARHLPPKWRRVANLVGGEAAPEEVADAIAPALAETLRRAGGCPGLGDLANAATAASRSEDRAEFDRRAEEVLEGSRGTPSFPHVQSAVEVANSLLVSGDLEGLSEGEASARISQSLCRRLVHVNLSDRLLPKLVQQSPRSFDEHQRFLQRCVDAADLDTVGQRLLAHEDGKNLRAPTRRSRRDTADLLYAPISNPGGAA